MLPLFSEHIHVLYVCVEYSEKIVYRHEFFMSLLRNGLKIFSIGVNTLVLENPESFPWVNIILHAAKGVCMYLPPLAFKCMYVCMYVEAIYFYVQET